MKRITTIWRSWLGGGCCLLALSGCQSWFKSKGPPHDPLFESRKPVESKAKMLPPQDVAPHEITPPTDPYNSQAARQNLTDATARR